jgi:localization factor PodJL
LGDLGVGMKIGVPWRVKGIRPDARETAREAARRAGMSVGEWLNTVILDSADEEGVRMSRRSRGYDDEDDDDQLFAIHERLDQLSDQFDRLQHRSAPARQPYVPQAHGPEAYAPPSYFQNRANQERDSQIAEAIARLDRRMDELANASRSLAAAPPVYVQTPPAHYPAEPHYVAEPRPAEPARPAAPNADAWVPDVNQAMAEIRARIHALDADPNAPAARPPESPRSPQAAPPQMYAPAPAPAIPAQNLAGLEHQLRHITGQIEALRQQPRLDEGLAALRETLREIARTLLEAMPRQAIDSLEAEVRALAARLDQTRSAGVDGNTLAAIEQGLTEIRDALHALTPAENLDGFRQAVHSLAQKVDMLGASAPDMNAYQQLEEAISTLRGIVNHVASNEALQQLADEVHALAQKVDHVAAAAAGGGIGVDHGALEILDQRIAHIASALESRVENGGSVPPQLETVIHGLTEKIERLQQSHVDEPAFAHLEGRVAQLLEKLDASGARFSQLEAIERGLGDLVAHLESQQHAPVAPQMEGLQRDLVRTQTSLEAVHGTLGHVVDRLATLESDMRGARPQPQPQPPQQPPAPHHEPSPLAFDTVPEQPMPAAPQLDMPALSEPPIFAAPAPQPSPPPSREVAHAQAAAAMARANPRSSARPPIDPNLPPDEPLEPGYAPGRSRASSADRIAASEAALGPARRAESSDPNNTSNFIAAARRAARAAASEPTTADLRAAALQNEVEEKASKSFAQRVRQLFVGASVIVIGVGGLRIAAELFDLGIDFGSAPVTQTAAVAPPPQPENAPLQDTPTLFAPKPQAAPAPQTAASNDSAASDVTGSLPSPAPAAQPAAPYLSPPTYNLSTPSSPAAPQPEKLPVAIGGVSLRAAAAAGDAAAEYEVAIRYAEGRGVAANPTEAARWFELAAHQGLVMAQFRLAGFYEKGIGVKKDTETARRLYRSAADQGNAKAMHNLAVLYAEGAAVKPDYRSAAQWFRSAAEYGVPDSQYNLAILYARGIGVDQNLVESYKWFALAAAQGDADAGKKRDEVAKRLDAQALNTAKLAVKTFAAQRQPDAAISVQAPPGGWDAAASNPPEPAPKTKRAAPVRVGSR